MKLPLLSICIATYNRAGYIAETLDSIVPQLKDNIEVLIVDGASTDTTEEIIRAYTNKYDHIHYVRLPMKGGVDQDYDKAVELARGEWCWLFTDDDLLKPGAVTAVTEAINQEHDLIVVNAEVRSRELSTVLQRQRMKLPADKIYSPNEIEGLFIDASEYLSFIGAVVMRRNVWLCRDRKSYYGTEFIHVGVIFQEAFASTALLIAEPYIAIRSENAQWSVRHFDIWMFKWPKLVWSLKNISDYSKLIVSYKEPWKKYRVLIYQRSIGFYNAQVYRKYLSSMQTGVLWKCCAFFISFIPTWLCIGLCDIYFFFKK